MRKKGYFSTGEFAKLSGINKSTLFYYDRNNVFSPEIMEDNGYRYYSAYQFDELEMIFTFRYIGMPIEEIKRYVHEKSPEAYVEILKQKTLEAEQKAAEYARLHKYLQIRMALTEEGLNNVKNKVSIQERDQEYYYTTPNPYASENSVNEDYYVLESEHMYQCKRDNVISPYSVAEIYTWADPASDHSLRLKCYGTRLIERLDFDRSRLWTKPKGRYLTYYHIDGYPASEDYAIKIKEYAKRHKLELEDYIYEETLIDETSVPVDESIYNAPFVIKLSVRIKE